MLSFLFYVHYMRCIPRKEWFSLWLIIDIVGIHLKTVPIIIGLVMVIDVNQFKSRTYDLNSV